MILITKIPDVCKRFDTSLTTNGLQVPLEQVCFHLRNLSDFLLNYRRTSNVQQAENPGSRVILLSRSVDTCNLPSLLERTLRDSNCSLIPYTLTRSYDSYSAVEVLLDLIPDYPALANVQTVEHILMVSLPESMLVHGDLIGEVFMDKYSKKTVLAVTQKENRVIAGAPETSVVVAENNLTFSFDLVDAGESWGLEEERRRLLSSFGKGSLICDFIPGAGQLALSAAAQGHRVVTAATQSSLYQSIVENSINNKLHKRIHVVKALPLDVLEGLRDSLGKQVYEENTQDEYFLLKNPPLEFIPEREVNHIVLKTNSFEEVEALYGFYKGYNTSLPVLHIYTESDAPIPREDIIGNIKKSWMNELPNSEILSFLRVRANMYCVSVRMPPNIGFTENKLVKSICGSDEEQEDLRKSMLRDMDFMQNSIRDSLHMQTSALVSNLSSIIQSSNLKRPLPQDSPSKKQVKK